MEGESIRKPALVAHADWSKDPKKRWYATAVLEADGHYRVGAPKPVGCLSSYFRRLRGNLEADATVLAGFDFPIGLPACYAAKVGVTDFVDELPRFGHGKWDEFFCPARSRSSISNEQTLLSGRKHERNQEAPSGRGVGPHEGRRSEAVLRA